MSYDVLVSKLSPEDQLGGSYDESPIETRGIEDNGVVESMAPTSASESTTPSRKISTNRFMTVLTQFYSNNEESTDQQHLALQAGNSGSSSTSRTPTRGVETRIMTMWNNMRYGLSGKIRSNFSKEQPVWLMGRCYHQKYTPPSSMESSAELTNSLENKLYLNDSQTIVLDDNLVQEYGMDAIEGQNSENHWEEGIEGFKRDFFSRLWMTYRREFPIMNGSNYTSDCGWGCMLRSGQMLLAQALICHFLGRSWRWDPETQLHSTIEDNMHRKIIRWFGDSTSKNNPFSIHTFVTLGEEMGKKPGDWYGPSSVAHLIRQVVKMAAQENADLDGINVYVAKDCTIYIQDILDECIIREQLIAPWQRTYKPAANENAGSENQMQWKPLIILVPVRLGADKYINVNYANSLKSLLSTEYCIGIIGGRPKHSLYFVGFQEDKVIHLDPHYCQEMVDVNQDNFPVHTFHCKSPRKLKINKLDPSCCIGFYCQTKADFDNFVSSVQPYLQPVRNTQTCDRQANGSPSSQSQELNYPMFIFSRGRNVDNQTNEACESVNKPLHQQLSQIRQQIYQNDDDDEDESEEFVIV